MGRSRDQKILQWEYEFKVTNNLRKIILEYNPFEGWRLCTNRVWISDTGNTN